MINNFASSTSSGGFKVDIDGAYSDITKNGTRFIYDKEGKSFRVDKETLVYVRAPVTRRKSWSDLLTQLERENIFCENIIQLVKRIYKI